MHLARVSVKGVQAMQRLQARDVLIKQRVGVGRMERPRRVARH